MEFSMIGQEKGELLIQVTTWAGLTEQLLIKGWTEQHDYLKILTFI